MLPKILLGLGIFATLLSVLIFSGKISVGNKEVVAQGDVVLWGTLPETQMNSVIQSFNPQAKTYSVRYTYVPEADFNQRLLEALASGAGPDLILTPYQTILSQEGRILPFPLSNFPEKNFKDTYVDGASVLFGPNGALALPVSVDPMVLFYNRTLFSKHGIINPPASWDEVSSVTPSLVLRDNGKFVETSIALGTPTTPYAKDILMAIVNQLGQTPVVTVPAPGGGVYYNVQVNTPTTEGGEVLPLATVNRFFTQFGDTGQKTYAWSESLGNASDMFVAEKLAMYIGYAGELPTLRARNPRGSFEMTYFPQTKGYNTFSMGMRMYAIATLKSSRNPVAALTVESQFAGAGVAPSIAAISGAVPALRSYAATQGLDPVIARSMLVARGWYDSHPNESSLYTASMISDIINYRYGVNDASAIFVSRLRDAYIKK
jgi:ABC-type glycerol-3-phosphate transport system substrate-binding protein